MSKYKLTKRQRDFANNYIKTGNATQSYKDAGYAWNKEETAQRAAHKLLRENFQVSGYVRDRQEKLIAKEEITQEEIYGYLARLVRGQEQDTVAHVVKKNKNYEEVETTEIPVNHNTRLRSAETLLKTLFRDGNDNAIKVTIIDTLPTDDEE